MFEHTPKTKVIFSLEREKYHNLLKNYNFSGRGILEAVAVSRLHSFIVNIYWKLWIR